MIKKSKIVLITKVTLGTFLFTLFLGFILLFKGLTFDTISFPSVVIKGLYIKLDKKLVVTAQKVTITLPPTSKSKDKLSKNSAQKALLALREVSFLGNFISPIVINEIDIKGENLNVKLTNCAWVRDEKMSLMATNAVVNFTPPKTKKAKEPLTHQELEDVKKFFPEFDTITLDHLTVNLPTLEVRSNGIKASFGSKLSLNTSDLSFKTKGSQSPFTFSDLNPLFENILPAHDTLTTLIETIHLQKILINTLPLEVKYGKTIKIITDDVSWEGVVSKKVDKVILSTQHCLLHNSPVTIQGDITLVPSQKKLKGELQTTIDSIVFNTSFDASNKDISLHASTNHFSSLTPLGKLFPSNRIAQEWLTKRIKALNFYVDAQLSFSQDFKPLEHTIKSDAVIKNGVIIFDPNLPPLKVNEVHASITQKGITIHPCTATYESLVLNNLAVRFNRVFEPAVSTLFEISFQTPTLFTQPLKNLLDYYEVILPIEQTEGINHTDFNLSMDLETLKPNIAFNSTLSDGSIRYNNENVTYKDVKLHYLNDQLNFQIYNLCYKNDLNTSAHGLVDTNLQQGSALLALHHGSFGNTSNPLFLINEKIVPLNFSYKNGVQVTFPTLSTTISHNLNTTAITLSHLSKIYPFIPQLKSLALDDGYLQFTHSPQVMKIDGQVTGKHHLLVSQHNDIDPLTFNFVQEGNNFKTSIDHGNVTLENNNGRYKGSIENRDLNLTHLVEMFQTFKTASKETNTSSTPFQGIDFKAHNSKIYFNTATLPFDDLIIKHENNSSTLDGHYKTTHLHGSLKHNSILFFSPNISSDYFRYVTGFDGIKAKNTSLSFSGPLDDISGSLILEDGIIKDLGGLNTILAIINAVPSLFTLDFDLGFGGHGLTFNTATASFSYINDIIIINNLDIDGAHTDITAQGYINLKTKEIHLAINVSTIKALSSIISKIPIAGYLILGDAKNFGTELIVQGSIDQPEVQTFITKGFLLTPVNIAKRIITYPLELFKEVKNLFTTTGENE